MPLSLRLHSQPGRRRISPQLIARYCDDPARQAGRDAWKVSGNMFGCIGAVTPGVFVNTDSVETAQMLINAGVAVEAQYFHRSRVKLPAARARTDFGTSCHIVEAVSPSLTKKAPA